jgi:hypothetical protein
MPIYLSQHVHVLVQDLGYARSAPEGVTLPKDVTRREANRVHSEWLWVWRQRRRTWSTAWAAARVQGVDTPSEHESSGGDNQEEDEDEEEGEVTPPPNSPSPEDLPRLVTSSVGKRGFPWHTLVETTPDRDQASNWTVAAAQPRTGIF